MSASIFLELSKK